MLTNGVWVVYNGECQVGFTDFLTLDASFLYALRRSATPWGSFIFRGLTNCAIWVIMTTTVLLYALNKQEGDRAVYRLFALYGEIDKTARFWYNGKKWWRCFI